MSLDRKTTHATPAEDDWLDAILREDARATPPVADDGFSARVLGALPPRRRRAYGWIVPAMAALGGAAALALFPGGTDVVDGVTHVLAWRQPSWSSLVALVPVALLYTLAIAGAWGER